MKILMLTDKMGLGGAETHIITLARSLILRGDSITLISEYGRYVPYLIDIGVRYIRAPLDKRDILSVIKAIPIIKKEMKNSDVVHAHTRFTSTLVYYMKKHGIRVPTVSTAHLTFPIGIISKYTKWGDKTLAVSEDIKNYLIDKYGVDQSRILITKNCIYRDDMKEAVALQKNIIHVSRIDRGRCKTAFCLLDIAERISKEAPGYGILIIGDGDRYSELKARAEEINRRVGEELVRVPGGTTEVASYLKLGGIFVGVSRAALEAAAVGLPVIICGDEGYGGILCKDNFALLAESNFCARGCQPPEADLLSRDLLRLISDTGYSIELINYNKEKISAEYDSRIGARDATSAYNAARRRGRIVLCGYFGYGNIGDEGMLHIALDSLLDLGYKGIGILASAEEKKRMRHSTDVRYYDRFSPIDLQKSLSESDILVMCGGNLLQNETSNSSLLYYFTVMKKAHRMGLRIYMISSGIGGLSGRLSPGLATRALGLTYGVGARTSEDMRAIMGMGYGNSLFLMPDLAFLLYKSSDFPSFKHKCQSEKVAIVCSSRLEPYTDLLSGILKEQGLSCSVLSIFDKEDRDSALLISEKLGAPALSPKSYVELCQILSECRFSVSVRLHGGIFSLLAHTPCYLFDGYQKNSAFIDEVTKRCSSLKCNSPIMPLSSLAPDAFRQRFSEEDFDLPLSELYNDARAGFMRVFG